MSSQLQNLHMIPTVCWRLSVCLSVGPVGDRCRPWQTPVCHRQRPQRSVDVDCWWCEGSDQLWGRGNGYLSLCVSVCLCVCYTLINVNELHCLFNELSFQHKQPINFKLIYSRITFHTNMQLKETTQSWNKGDKTVQN